MVFDEGSRIMTKFFPLGCIIMASGHSTRFGSNKLLQEFHGQPLIQYILNTTQDLFTERIVVTRYSKIAKLCQEQGIPYLLHDKPYLNDTIRLGMAYCQSSELLGYAFCTSDQPFLRWQSVSLLCESFIKTPYAIQRLAYEQSPGNPIIFPADLASELQCLPQDKGGGVLAKKYPERVRLVQVQDKYELFDIDSVRDLRQCLNLGAARYLK